LIAATAFHTLLLENERVRVLEARIRPGEFVPVHTPSVTCVVSGSHFLRRDEKGALLFDSRTAGRAAGEARCPMDPAASASLRRKRRQFRDFADFRGAERSVLKKHSPLARKVYSPVKALY
jgi:hypothetical protein